MRLSFGKRIVGHGFGRWHSAILGVPLSPPGQRVGSLSVVDAKWRIQMKNEEQRISNERRLAIPAFGLSAVCFAVALFGDHGLFSSTPTLRGAGSIVGSFFFLLVGIHLRRSTKSNNEVSTDTTQT